MTELQRIERDLLRVFVEICEKHQLRYFLCGGTLLGCVRSNGFIPWDDDVDVDMPREDYERFLVVAKSELTDPFFLQTFRTDPGYFSGHAQLRNSLTAALLEGEEEETYNRGIFLDIFPLDDIPSDSKMLKKFERQLYILRTAILLGMPAAKKKKYRLKGRMLRIVCRLFVKAAGVWRLAEKYDALCKKYYDTGTDRFASIGVFTGRREVYWKKDLLAEVIPWEFEGLKVVIPANYDEILCSMYGDYTVPLKENINHKVKVLDTSRSYREY